MPRLINIIKPVLTLGFLLSALGAHAHEFWLQPHKYRIDISEPLVADVRVGMDFLGDTIPYLSGSYNVFNITDQAGTRAVQGRLGDLPAVNIPVQAEGLQVLNLFSNTSVLTWHEFEKFDHFVNLHGMGRVLETHTARGLPDTGFKEAYTRYVKTLVAVGNGAGQDHYTGMFFELVAGANPYTDDMSGGMPITVLFKGQPLPDKQVDLFFRNPDGELTRLSVQSNAEGRALVPNIGPGEYMVNVVHMVQPAPEDIEKTGVVWHSLWGSITYAIGV